MTTDRFEADAADVAEQHTPVFDEEREDLAAIELSPESNEADAVEQSIPVPMDEDERS